MDAIRFLPTKVHGVLDYLVGIVLILLPTIFQYSSAGGAEAWVPRALGVVLIVYSLLTKYEWGVVKVIEMPYHLVVDLLASIFLIATPFLFGFFNSMSTKAWVPDIVIGVVVVIVVIVTQTQPGGAKAVHVKT